tara:strand:+ start:410 stop:517 length:108 start_codon:yes stop_codon:yes gene_type:complete
MAECRRKKLGDGLAQMGAGWEGTLHVEKLMSGGEM